MSEERDRPPYDWIEVEDVLEGRVKVKPPRQRPEGELETCPRCGNPMRWLYWESAPMTWQMLCGRGGWIQVCAPCKHWTGILDGFVLS